jgi:tetratricopeptide (TPR) repeat protein
LADLLTKEGKPDEAEPVSREALETFRSMLGPEHTEVATALNNLADILHAESKLPEAEATSREALAMEKRLAPDGHPSVMKIDVLAAILRDQGKLVEAEACLREGLNLARAASKEPLGAMPDLGRVLHHLAEVLRLRHDLTQARLMAEEALRLYQNHPQWRSAEREHAFQILVVILQDLGDSAGIVALYERDLEQLRATVPAGDPGLAGGIALVVLVLLGKTEFSKAEPLARECLAIREAKMPDDWLTFNSRSMLGASLLGQKKYVEAEPLLLSGYEGMREREAKIPSAARSRLKEAMQRLVALYEITGRSAQAAPWQKKIEDMDRAQTNQPPPAKPPAKP